MISEGLVRVEKIDFVEGFFEYVICIDNLSIRIIVKYERSVKSVVSLIKISDDFLKLLNGRVVRLYEVDDGDDREVEEFKVSLKKMIFLLDLYYDCEE